MCQNHLYAAEIRRTRFSISHNQAVVPSTFVYQKHAETTEILFYKHSHSYAEALLLDFPKLQPTVILVRTSSFQSSLPYFTLDTNPPFRHKTETCGDNTTACWPARFTILDTARMLERSAFRRGGLSGFSPIRPMATAKPARGTCLCPTCPSLAGSCGVVFFGMQGSPPPESEVPRPE
jgi:hypothetical protein